MHRPHFRRTKIIITLGPASESESALERLIQAGADVVRLNMAHAKHEWVRTVIRRVRAVSARLNKEVSIMMDIKGPEIRTGDVAVPYELKVGELFDFLARPQPDRPASEVRSVSVNYADIVKDVAVGDTVLVDSGLIRLKVLEKDADHLRCQVLVPGRLGSRRHINLPGVRVNLPSFTEKDRADTLVGIEEGIDYVALSFVREGRDIDQLVSFLQEHRSRARVIAKIEDQQAIANLDEIVRASHGLMVARGDLGIECPFEELPILQRRAVQTCLAHGRPVIIATHMLETMIENPVPTRAEITDIANAVFEEADCIMLSGETTIGKYPVESVQVFDKVARRMEQVEAAGYASKLSLASDKLKVLRSAVVMADQLLAAGIVVFTRQGFMAQGLAALRPRHSPIFAITNNLETQRQLALLRSVDPLFLTFSSQPEETVLSTLKLLKDTGRVEAGAKLVIVSDILASNNQLVDSIQLRTVG
ncbi:MAG: pyruvate kinase [Opitutaceae bacterium]|nr:pyruvate kinase [Opitutaceae bacterium]